VVGAATEHERAGKTVQAYPGKSYNLAGKTSLAELAGVLSLSRLHIGVDSAAPHIAAAVGTPTITLYGPSDWRTGAPVGDRAPVVVPDWTAYPVTRKGATETDEANAWKPWVSSHADGHPRSPEVCLAKVLCLIKQHDWDVVFNFV